MPASFRIVLSTEPEDGEPADSAGTFLAETVPEETGVEALSPLLIGFHQSLRMWKFKGHTPTEIVTGKLDPEGGEIISFEAARRKKAKVGRNDPCPCGSGKKYKNCCMRKDMGEA